MNIFLRKSQMGMTVTSGYSSKNVGLLRQVLVGAMLAILAAGTWRWCVSLSEMRYAAGIVGLLVMVVASLLAVRRNLVNRGGSYRGWVRLHEVIAMTGVTLILMHGLRARWVWHSWLTFGAVVVATGIGIGLAKATRWRKRLIQVHLVLMPVVLATGLAHGYLYGGAKPNVIGAVVSGHDRWMPLAKAHDVACVACHPQPSVAYGAYTCRGCHEHDTVDVRTAHEMLSLTSYERCFDCHQAAMRGRMIGKRTASWGYDRGDDGKGFGGS